MKALLLFIFISFAAHAQAFFKFEDYFTDKTLRIDYYHAGNKTGDSYYFDEMIEEGKWAGSKVNLIDKFNYGKYKVEVTDAESGRLIYSKHYSTLFSEWQTTEEANIISKSFSETVVIPFPLKKVKVKFYTRDKKNLLHEKYSMDIDPADYFIKKERRNKYPVFDLHVTGESAKRVDIVIIPEGYTAGELDKFKKDARRLVDTMLSVTPFKQNSDKFNFYLVLAPSEESGTDIPAKRIWKSTVASTSFYTFDEERYLMTEDNKAVRDLAANAPYEHIYILVNSSKYGGGAIYNHYAVSVADNNYSPYVFVHEFGHSFGFLADEYYTSSTAYVDFYPLDVEPLEANITTLVNFESKWKHLVPKNVPVPTPAIPEYLPVVGVFEGGGYVAKGVYRPKQDCTMFSITIDNFCPVCKKAIEDLISFQCE